MDWQNEHRVGIHELDDQHKAVIACLSDIEQAVARRETATVIQGLLGQLLNMAELHFTVEESLMRIHEYARLEEHIDHHRTFSAHVKALRERSLTAGLSLNSIHFMREWWAAHIQKEDKAYALHFLKRTALADPLT